MILEKNSVRIIGENSKMNILIFAPHNDDEILGVGGTMRKYIEEGHDVYVCEITSGKMYKTLQNEACQAHQYLGVKATYFLNLPVGELKIMKPYEVNAAIDDIIKKVKPEIVYLPFIGDMHLDHREVTEAAMVALRPIGDYSVREIYMYETLSETGWNIPCNDRSFNPNVWVDITSTINTKVESMGFYKSQLIEYPHPRSIEAIKALAMYRGTTIGVKYAESFMLVRKIVRD